MLDRPINGESFTAWVEQFLIPELEPGSILVIDNLGTHKGSRVCSGAVSFNYSTSSSSDINIWDLDTTLYKAETSKQMGGFGFQPPEIL